MESVRKTQFCAICGRNHDPKFTCASVTGFDAIEEMGIKTSKGKDAESSVQNLSRKTDKIMVLIVILVFLSFIASIFIMQI